MAGPADQVCSTAQVNYVLGATGFSWLVGFGENYPDYLWHKPSYNSFIDWPLRSALLIMVSSMNAQQCHTDLRLGHCISAGGDDRLAWPIGCTFYEDMLSDRQHQAVHALRTSTGIVGPDSQLKQRY